MCKLFAIVIVFAMKKMQKYSRFSSEANRIVVCACAVVNPRECVGVTSKERKRAFGMSGMCLNFFPLSFEAFPLSYQKFRINENQWTTLKTILTSNPIPPIIMKCTRFLQDSSLLNSRFTWMKIELTLELILFAISQSFTNLSKSTVSIVYWTFFSFYYHTKLTFIF